MTTRAAAGRRSEPREHIKRTTRNSEPIRLLRRPEAVTIDSDERRRSVARRGRVVADRLRKACDRRVLEQQPQLDRLSEPVAEPRDRPLCPGDLLATWYRHLRVPLDTHHTDQTGRPVPLLPEGRPIEELS